MDERKRRGSLVGPAILIGLGIVFMLNNLGILDWSIWEVIFRLWPVLIIAAGLDLLIGHRSIWGSLLALVLILAVLAGALWLSWVGIGAGQVVAAEEVRQALDGATRAEVVIEPGVGSLHIKALPESANLVEGMIRVGRGQRVKRHSTVVGKTVTLILQGEGATFGPFIGWNDQRSWDLGLAPEVPLGLEVNLGAGLAGIDLTGLTVGKLEVSMGVGQITVILPDEGRLQARIEGAIGETIVVIPAGMEARIRFSTALVSRHLPAGYRRQDDVYTSPGYESAENRVDLEVGLAMGRVTIRHSGTR